MISSSVHDKTQVPYSCEKLPPKEQVNSGFFYAEYHGHPIPHLECLHAKFKERMPAENSSFIFLAGDSSLDNKHWFFGSWPDKATQLTDNKDRPHIAPAVNGYEDLLTPPKMVKDVSYWTNALAEKRFGNGRHVTINASVEESTISDRDGRLLAQDIFIRDHIGPDDTLVLSVGGNDVALRPTTWTIVNVFLLTRAPTWAIKNNFAVGMWHMENLFHRRIQDLLRRMLAKDKPRKVVVCMIYFLDETAGGSWADFTLRQLGYDDNPAKLQLIIRKLFERIQARGFEVEGTEVEYLPLFEVLDGKNTDDYVQRVEPSIQGGKKMAESFLRVVFPEPM
mmetsp:Transcript_58964/g.80500  ORF Transcript_58964/g.80500 Transcript_58964/m.80500 type:complete len:336 (-) Transcript_58964:61-1068(-)